MSIIDTEGWCSNCKQGKECSMGTVSCPDWYERKRKRDEEQKKLPISEYSGYDYGSDYSTGSKYKSGSSYGSSYSGAKTGSGMPYGLRFRCMSCGHWLKSDSDLATHAQWCCPASSEDPLNWTIQCECCDTLDEAAQVRSGWVVPSNGQEPKQGEEAHVHSGETDQTIAG